MYMKKIVYILVLVLAVGMILEPCYASEVNKDISVKAKTEYDITDVVEGVRVDEEVITVKMDDGTVIRATGEFEDSIRLMVMPITKSMTKEWNWLQSVTRKIGENKSAYDIFFINSKGERVDGGEGSQISVMTRQKLSKLMVYYIEASGKETKLESTMEEYAVKFKMMKNGYYTLVMQSTSKKPTSSSKKSKKKANSKKKDTANKDKNNDDNNDDDDDDDKDKDKDNEDSRDDNLGDLDGNDGDSGDGFNDESGDKDFGDLDNSDTDATKRPIDGSGKEDEDEKEEGEMNILYRIGIVFVFIATGIIFFIILRKKNKKDEEDEYNKIE